MNFLVLYSPKGLTNLTKRAPDTITSWIITGFSLHSVYGLGLTSQPTKLTIFQPFFVSLNLPYSVKRGEVLALQVLVFNYLQNNETATITLLNDLKEFEFIEESNVLIRTRSIEVFVPAENGASVSFMIRPLKVGHITIKVV